MLGYTPDVFYRLTPRQFSNALIGFNEKENNRLKQQWEMVRLNSFYTVAPHSKKIKKPRDLFKLPWEKLQKVEILSQSQMKNFADLMRQAKPVKKISGKELLNIANNGK